MIYYAGKHRGRLDGAYMDINDMMYIKKQKKIYIYKMQ